MSSSQDEPQGLEPAGSAENWRAARDFDELCELGALFVEGRLETFPGWGAAETDEETDDIGPTLAAANRAGFLTLASQRGELARAAADGREERRRAFVCGFANDRAAHELEALVREGLLVLSYGAREREGSELAVGTRGGDVFLVAGHAAGPLELEIFAEHVSAAALEHLRRTRYLWIVEPEWGRDDRMWQALARAVGSTY